MTLDLDKLTEISYVADSTCMFDAVVLQHMSKELGRPIEAKQFVVPLSQMPDSVRRRHRAAARAVAEALGHVFPPDEQESK